MQFYTTANFYPDEKIVWMIEGTRYQSTVDEWAKPIKAPKEHEKDIDVYAEKKKDHNSMANMYKEIPDKALETHKLGSVYDLMSGLATMNTILSMLPKSGDHRMIRGHSINLLQMFDLPQKFKVMSLIVETIKRIAADQKRSCGYAPHIQMLINSKMPKGVYLLDKEHLPLKPDFEDNTIVMTAKDPTSLEAQEKRQKAKAEKATKMPSAEEASEVFLKLKQDQLGYLIQSTLRTEKGLATLTQNQEILERITKTKFYDLDLKVTEIQTSVEELQEEVEERKGKATTQVFHRVPREKRSAVVPVPETRTTTSAPAATAPVAPPMETPPAPSSSTDAFCPWSYLNTPPEDQAQRDA